MRLMRFILVLGGVLAALGASAVTPEVGKDKLRKLVKPPAISFQSDWTFDPERGFAIGSGAEDSRAQLADLLKEFKADENNPEVLDKIGELYSSLGDVTNARDAWTRSTGVYRKRVDSQPDNGVLLAGFGHALAGAGKKAEAESVLRRAVQTAPAQWECRVALGQFLDSEARRSILGRTAQGDGGTIAPGEVALARKQLTEAGDCFNRAVTLATNESEVYFRRAMHQCLEKVLQNQIQSVSGNGENQVDPFDDCFTPKGLEDIQRASRLRPDDYRLVGATVLFEIYTVNAKKGRVAWEDFSWNSLPEKNQASIREALTRLENLAQNPEPRAAAGALEVLGILQGPILHQPDACIASLRRALALQPSRDQAGEVLVAALAQAGRYDDLLAVCEDRVKQDDSARAHLLLAKAHEKLRQWDECENEARIAVSEDPENFNAALSIAALLIKRSHDNPAVLSEADNWLTRSEGIAGKTARARRNQQQIIDLTLTRGIYFALTDEMDNARTWVKTVIDRDKGNQLAQEILAAMDF